MFIDRSIVIDLETTGFSPQRGDRVIEIGAVVVERGELVDEFQTLIQVPRSITRQASRVHGITDQMLAGQPLPEEVFPELFPAHAGMNRNCFCTDGDSITVPRTRGDEPA